MTPKTLNGPRIRLLNLVAESDIETARQAMVEIERQAFKRGARAMRELIASDMSDELADHILDLPLPEMEAE